MQNRNDFGLKNHISKFKIFIKLSLLFSPIFLLSILLPLTGCIVNPSETPQISQTSLSESSIVSSRASQTDTESNSETAPPVKLHIIYAYGQMMLGPASPAEYLTGKEIGNTLFYTLSEDMSRWEPADCTFTKIGSVTGRSYFNTQDSTTDVYQIKIGDWIGYCKTNPYKSQGNDESRILFSLEDSWYSHEMELCTKDYTVMQIYDDLYAVGAGEKLKMVSSRKTGAYDYETSDKSWVGDHKGWQWVCNPVCSKDDNLIYYLTSREKEYYSIWSLDLDSGAEKRFGVDVPSYLDGVGNGQLVITRGIDSDNSTWMQKLIQTSNPTQFTEKFYEMNECLYWGAEDGWLYFSTLTDTTLWKGNNQIEININIARNYSRMFLTENILWFVQGDAGSNPIGYIRIDLNNSTFTLANATYENDIDGWNKLLSSMKSNESPLETNNNIIKIVIPK